MAILTFKVDEDNVTEFQYEQALKVITLYIEAEDKAVKEQELLIEQAKEQEFLVEKANDIIHETPKELSGEQLVIQKVNKAGREANKSDLINEKAKAVNDYQKLHFKQSQPTKEIEIKVKPKVVKAKVIKEVKPKVDKGVNPELDANGKKIHFNLFLNFSAQFIEILEAYFLTYHKAELNPIRVSRSELSNMNIFKFNRLTNFKSHHVIRLVKFLNDNEITCTHELDRHNKLVAKIMK
jgi:hypothetical protein